MSFDFEGSPEDFLEDLREGAQSLPLQKLRKAKAKFEQMLSGLRQRHSESDEVSYAGPIDTRRPLDQIRFYEQAIDICDTQITARGRSGQKAPSTVECSPEKVFTHDDDYRNISFNGKPYTLTSQQSRAVEFLHQQWEQGVPQVTQSRVMEHLESPSSRLKDTFRGSPLWGKDQLVIPGTRKGTVRLNVPAKPH